MVVFVYNYNELLSANRAMKVTHGTFDAVDDDGTDFYTDTNSILHTTNAIVGAYSYRILYQNNLHFDLTISNLTSITASTDIHFKYVAYNFIIFEFIICDTGNATELMVSTRMCYP